MLACRRKLCSSDFGRRGRSGGKSRRRGSAAPGRVQPGSGRKAKAAQLQTVDAHMDSSYSRRDDVVQHVIAKSSLTSPMLLNAVCKSIAAECCHSLPGIYKPPEEATLVTIWTTLRRTSLPQCLVHTYPIGRPRRGQILASPTAGSPLFQQAPPWYQFRSQAHHR